MKKELSLKDTIYNAILEDIYTMDYLPGEILNEKNLVEKYNCSKSPVREALITLCNENVLRSIPRYGYEVVRLTVEDIAEMIQFRYLLEGGILRSRYKKISSAQLERLSAIDEKCKMEINDVWKHWEYNTEFHLKLIGFCGSNYALEELQRCMTRLKRAYTQFYWNKENIGSLPTDTRNHSAILSCIKSHDIDGALKFLKEDLNDFGGLETGF